MSKQSPIKAFATSAGVQMGVITPTLIGLGKLADTVHGNLQLATKADTIIFGGLTAVAAIATMSIAGRVASNTSNKLTNRYNARMASVTGGFTGIMGGAAIALSTVIGDSSPEAPKTETKTTAEIHQERVTKTSLQKWKGRTLQNGYKLNFG